MALNADLVDFVRQSLRAGLSRAEIEGALVQAGWPADQARRALRGFAEVDFPVPVPSPASHAATREAFFHLVMFATLVVSAYSLGNLLFQLIDRAFPDPLTRNSLQPTLQAIRWSLSSLIVAFPIFLYAASLVGKAVRRDPGVRSLRARRQLTYLTLFAAAAILIGDLIGVVYNFLGGEITMRFLLKVLTVALIAGGVFVYYLLELRADEQAPET
jgi:hypothetical protein